MSKTICAMIAVLALNIGPTARALASECASADEATALKTAVMQQEMMVAALQCHEADAYNRFVVAYRPELQSSDAALKTFFVRQGGARGEAGYDTFKTKAANLSALEQARNAHGFCTDAHALLTAALAHRGSLASFVESRSSRTDIDHICAESGRVPELERTAAALASTSVTIASAPVKPMSASVKSADLHPRDETLPGVPAFSMPVMPYRQADAAGDRLDRQDQPGAATPGNGMRQDQALPEPHYYQIRDRDYAYDETGNYAAMAPPSYGPPPGWRNYPAAPQGYGWYPRSAYDTW